MNGKANLDSGFVIVSRFRKNNPPLEKVISLRDG